MPIALLINFLAFSPFLYMNGWDGILRVWTLALLFAAVNSVLEEVLWRGVLLSRFAEQFGEKRAVLLTSIGFGLQHYSLGFPWGVCLAFAVGGFYFAGITVRSGSLVPAILWHFAINVLMVCSGLLFSA
ncbi:CPBP family intramembrane metalloprotease [Paenibacillus sp. TRM 82003]|nr:CPBP family intramembrane metalloprotease [Paenibacillus sp. TRM 82003]